MTPQAARPGGSNTTFGRTLVILALIWNIVVPLLAQDDGVDVQGGPVRASEAGTGSLLRRTPDGLVPLPVLDIDVRLQVAGILVHGTVAQTFRNPTGEVIDCVYVFPLPERAAVHRMEMRVGGRRIISVIEEKEEAKRVYEKARQEGRKAALVEQERPNLFTTSAAAINPGESIEIVLEYLQEIAFDGDAFSLAFPLTLTPRFTTGPREDSTRITPPLARPGSPAFPRASLGVRIDAGVPVGTVESDTHPIETFHDGGVLVVEPR